MNEQERRIKELEAQNAQMGEVIGQMAHDHAEQGREIARLERENAEVRELVKDLYEMVNDCDSDSYPSDWKKAEYLRRVQKLGIKVEVGC